MSTLEQEDKKKRTYNSKKIRNNKFKTEELCRIAVAKDGDALEYVPEQFKAKIVEWLEK